MTRRRMVFFGSLAVFMASFFVTAVHSTDIFHFSVPGYLVALSTLLSPWGNDDSMQDLSRNATAYLSFLLSGIINPLFLVALALLHTRRMKQLGKLLRIIVIGLFPACWIYFWQDGMRPSAGYFLWTIAMLVALFAISPKGHADSVEPNSLEPEKPKEASASTTFLLLEAAEGPVTG